MMQFTKNLPKRGEPVKVRPQTETPTTGEVPPVEAWVYWVYMAGIFAGLRCR